MTRLSDSRKKKSTCWLVDFAVPADHKVKLKENEKRDNYQDLGGELKKMKQKSMVHEGNGGINCNWCSWDNPQMMCKGTKTLRNQRTSRDIKLYLRVKLQFLGYAECEVPFECHSCQFRSDPMHSYLSHSRLCVKQILLKIYSFSIGILVTILANHLN